MGLGLAWWRRVGPGLVRQVRLGWARRVVVSRGEVWLGGLRQARHGGAGFGALRCGQLRYGTAWLGQLWCGSCGRARFGSVGSGRVWLGAVRHGGAWQAGSRINLFALDVCPTGRMGEPILSGSWQAGND